MNCFINPIYLLGTSQAINNHFLNWIPVIFKYLGIILKRISWNILDIAHDIVAIGHSSGRVYCLFAFTMCDERCNLIHIVIIQNVKSLWNSVHTCSLNNRRRKWVDYLSWFKVYLEVWCHPVVFQNVGKQTEVSIYQRNFLRSGESHSVSVPDTCSEII